MPRRGSMRERWVRVNRAFHENKVLPPVKVLEIGGLYFVRDGNRRVSVARLHDMAYIDAEITRLNGGVQREPGMTMVDIERRVTSCG